MNGFKKRGQATHMEKPKKPPQRRLIVEDITVEALVDVLIENPKGILIVKDELSGFIGSFDAYKNSKNGGKDRAAFLELYNGGPKMVDRVNRGRMYISNWSASIIGGIQPGSMRRLMGKITDDGLLQRFIPIFVCKKGDGTDRPPVQEVLDAFYKAQERISKMRVAPDEGDNSNPGLSVVKFSPVAQKCRKMVIDTVNRVMVLPDTSPAFKGHLSKYDGLFARIALTFHVVKHISHDIPLIPFEISGKTAMMTAKLILDYLLPNAARFYSDLIGNSQHFNDA